MLTLLKSGLDFLAAGGSVVGNTNIVLYPMVSNWFSRYEDSVSNSDYLFLDASSVPVGFPALFSTDYDGLETRSSSNRQRLLLLNGVDTSNPTSPIASNNSSETRRWLVVDSTTSTPIGYVDLGELTQAAFTAGVTLTFDDDVFGSMEVNNGVSYPFSDAIESLYSGGVNIASGLVELAVVKRTDGNDVTDNDLISSTTGQTITKITAGTTLDVLASGVPFTHNAVVNVDSASFQAQDQVISLPTITETKCTILLTLKDTDKSIIKIAATNIAIDGYVILNFSDFSDRFVLL